MLALRARALLRLAFAGIAGNSLRSWLVAGCAVLVAGLVLSMVLLSRGGEDSLRLARERLGADVVVVPRGSVAGVEGALLFGNATNTYLRGQAVKTISKVPGVAVASPQLYLTSMANSSCCSVSLMFMFAYDPTTDFTIEPWLKEELSRDLSVGQAVGGANVMVPEGQKTIKLYGYDFELVGNLDPTGTNLDQTLFMTFASAYQMAEVSRTKAKMALPVLANTVSSVMVKVKPGENREEVAQRIAAAVPDAEAIPAAGVFGSYGAQISGVLRTMLAVVALTVVLSLALVAIVFWMAVHDRRRQIGVLRALGATQGFVLLLFLTEAVSLALAGGLVGTVLASVSLYLFRDALVSWLGFPFLFPSFAGLFGLIVVGLLIASMVVAVAAFIPALRASREEPAVSMRE